MGEGGGGEREKEREREREREGPIRHFPVTVFSWSLACFPGENQLWTDLRSHRCLPSGLTCIRLPVESRRQLLHSRLPERDIPDECLARIGSRLRNHLRRNPLMLLWCCLPWDLCNIQLWAIHDIALYCGQAARGEPTATAPLPTTRQRAPTGSTLSLSR